MTTTSGGVPLLLVGAVLAGLFSYRYLTRSRDRALATARELRPGWWVGAVHGTPGLYRGLLAEGTYAPGLRRPRRFAVVLAAGPPGLELWDARRGVVVAAWPWQGLASVTSGRAAEGAATPALSLETLSGAVLPLVLAARGTGWAAAGEAEVDAVVEQFRALRDAAG